MACTRNAVYQYQYKSRGVGGSTQPALWADIWLMIIRCVIFRTCHTHAHHANNGWRHRCVTFTHHSEWPLLSSSESSFPVILINLLQTNFWLLSSGSCEEHASHVWRVAVTPVHAAIVRFCAHISIFPCSWAGEPSGAGAGAGVTTTVQLILNYVLSPWLSFKMLPWPLLIWDPRQFLPTSILRGLMSSSSRLMALAMFLFMILWAFIMIECYCYCCCWPKCVRCHCEFQELWVENWKVNLECHSQGKWQLLAWRSGFRLAAYYAPRDVYHVVKLFPQLRPSLSLA